MFVQGSSVASRLVFVAILLAAIPAHGQDMNGLKLGMSKAAVCRFLAEKPTYHLEQNQKCPGLEDFVTVEGTNSSNPVSSKVNVIFHDDVVHAMWAAFPSTDFFSVLGHLMHGYGAPQQVTGMEKGKPSVKAGPYESSLKARNVTDLIDGGILGGGFRYPGSDAAPFTNGYVYWRVGRAHVFLEEQNETVDGVMMGWFAMVAPDEEIYDSR